MTCQKTASPRITGFAALASLIALLALSSFPARALVTVENSAPGNRFASAADQANFLTISSIEIHEVPTDGRVTAELLASLDLPSLPAAAPGLPTLPGTGSVIGDIGKAVTGGVLDINSVQSWITLGEKIWQLIEKNRPVANVKSQRVSVLPIAQQDWQQMESWQAPMVKSYVIEAKNLFGVTCVQQTYALAFNYGGKYQGKGAYLANATIIPSQVNVLWGYTLNSSVEVGQAVNVSSKDNPIPGIDLQMGWSIETTFKHAEQHTSYFVRGDGQIAIINP